MVKTRSKGKRRASAVSLSSLALSSCSGSDEERFQADDSSGSDDDSVVENKTKTRTITSTTEATRMTTKAKKKAEVRKKVSPKNAEIDESSDEEIDSDSDSDIGEMFRQVQSRRGKAKGVDSSSESESDSDSESGSGSDSEDDNSKEEASDKDGSPGKRGRFADRLNKYKKRAKVQEVAKKVVGVEDNSDSDSDIEIVDASSTVAQKKSIDYASSDDEKCTKTGTKHRNSDFAKAMKQLENAQSYHADELEEVEVVDSEVEDDDIEVVSSPSKVLRNSTNDVALKPKQNLGAMIQIKVRSNQGKTECIFKIRMNEPFQALMDEYVKKHKVSKANARKLKFVFDGDQCKMNCTPASLDMESDDMIDVLTK